jgi:hypothetical protein
MKTPKCPACGYSPLETAYRETRFCKECAHWSIVGNEDEVRYCERLGNEQEGLTCGCAIPGSGATIYTGPSFGCVHWEAKDADN